MDSTPDSQLIAYLPVRDLAATRDFYARDLGLSPLHEREGCLVFGAPGPGRVGFRQYDGGAQLAPHECLSIVLVTPDVEGAYRRLRRVGAEIDRPPGRDAFATHPSFSARDPDGYRVEIRSAAPPGADPAPP